MPDPAVARLLTRAERLAALEDRISQRFARQLASVLRDVERELARIDWPTASTSALVRASDAIAIRGQLRGVLERSGYRELIQAGTDVPFDTVAARASKLSMVAAGAGLPDVPQRLGALRELHRLDLLTEERRIADLLAQSATRAVVAGVPRRVLLDDLERVLDKSRANVATLYDTSVSVYGREVEAIQAGDNPKALFMYVGPADAKTRKWCLRYVGRVLTRREIDKLDNGQLGQPFLTGGGYNCRHQWTEISPASELAGLQKSKRRVPEVRADVRRQRAS